MNLRFPLVVAVVAVAAGAAGFRALRPPAQVEGLAVTPPSETPAGLSRGHLPAIRPTAATIVVYVAGEVARSGVYTVPSTARGADALRAAGGPLPDADLVAVNLAARLADGDELAVPARGAAPHRTTRKTIKGASESRRQTGHKRKRKRRHAAADSSDAAADSSSAEAPAELVDLNEADVDVLQTLPGIGPALAERIVAVRDQSGPFVSTDDLLDVGGMTQSKVDAIAPYITLR